MTSDFDAHCIAQGRRMAVEALLKELLARLSPPEHLAVASRLGGALTTIREGMAGMPGGEATVGGFEILLLELGLIE
jgi:hypothetical protein